MNTLESRRSFAARPLILQILNISDVPQITAAIIQTVAVSVIDL